MKKLISTLSLLLLVLGFSINTSAQSPAKVQWSCIPPDSQNVSVVQGALIGMPEAGSDGFAVRSYTGAAGPLGQNQRWWPYANGAAVSWGNETGQVNSRYIQFAVTSKEGFIFHADTLKMYIGGGGTSKLKANVVYSTKYNFSDSVRLNSYELALGNNVDSLFTFVINKDIAEKDTFYVRIYPWYTDVPSTSKYLLVQDVWIIGSAKSPSFPAFASWPLSSVTTTAVTVSGNISAESEMLRGTEINQYTGANGSQRVRMAGTNNTWPANITSQIDTVFVQFAVSPKSGSSFNVDSVSLAIGAASTKTMKANIWYSTDSTFAVKTAINYSTGDSSNYLISSGQTIVKSYPNLEIPDGKIFYLRIYPWHESTTSASGKYVTLQNVLIAGGSSGQVIILPPTVTTAQISNLSTTSVKTGGTVTSDGGGDVTARGVCWNTTGNPTIKDSIIVSGSGAGPFTCDLKNLIPGTKYYLRAYATNSKATGYGNEIPFTTLSQLSTPLVTTSPVTNILTTTAISGGEVTFDGGLPVTIRGICWNTKGNPTVSDNKSEDGEGLGIYKSTLYGLQPNTTYFIRAYAMNSQGVAYGDTVSFKTSIPLPNITKVVSQDGSGDFKTVQAAFDAVPENYTGIYTIFVKNGTYKEKLLLSANKVNVVLTGEDRNKTILTYDDYTGKAAPDGTTIGTMTSYSVAIDAGDFVAKNITFQNTSTAAQAVALRTNGDRQIYQNCRMVGYQDTYYAWGGSSTQRIYNKDCYIEGSVDFIFGRNITVFDSCTININRNTGTLTAASTEAFSKYGLVFQNCKITTDSVGFDGKPITAIYLGRPWQASPRTVFINCQEPVALHSDGWQTWNVVPALYAEYNCSGPGFQPDKRLSIAKQLTAQEASEYTLTNIFAKNATTGLGFDWVPKIPLTGVEERKEQVKIPDAYSLEQNYPNPFNPATKIQYSLPKTTSVKLEVFDIIGKKIATLVNETNQSAGYYTINFDASRLPSGIYIYTLVTQDQTLTKKMMLLK